MRARLALAIALLAAAPYAAAQTYPSKPIRLILPFSGGTELIGRMVGGKLAPVLGQQVVADPRYGAAGSIGWEAAAKAPADGYTLVMGAVPLLTNPHIYAKVGYDPLKSFAPIALIATIPNVLIGHPSVPATSLKALIAVARRSPGKLVYGSAPGLPTRTEAGMPQLVAVNWYALLAPTGTPRPVIDLLNAEAVKAMNAQDTRASLAAMGGEPDSASPEETAKFLRTEYARWGSVIAAAKIKAE